MARALEVNPNVLHRWRREFRQGPGNAFPGQRQAALVGGPDRRTGAEGRPADAGDRFFEGVLAAHRGAADAAGTDWKSAVYRKIQEEVKADRGLTVERMVELGGVSRASFYRFDEDGRDDGRIGIWTCATPSSGSPWSCPATAGRGSPPNCDGRAGR